MTPDPPIDELKAIAHPLRFRILQLLKEGEMNVGELDQASGIGQPSLSQQLGILRKANLVETRKEAKLVFYSANIERLEQIGAMIGARNGDSKTRREHQEAMKRTPSPGVANFARLS